MIRSLLKKAGYLLYVVAIVFILLEIALRMYNPLNPRLKGDKIVLPVRQRYEVQIENLPNVRGKAIHTKNSLGFRGADPPADWATRLTILAVGGSTTECYFLTDGTDWPTILEKNLRPALPTVWVNNAGLNGHSTFGHQILLDDYVVKLKPDLALFLIGVNDVGIDDLGGFDGAFLKNSAVRMGDAWYKDWARTVVKNSEVIGLIRLISRGVKTQKLRFRDDVHLVLRPADTLALPPARIEAELAKLQPRLPAYAKRVEGLVQTCRNAGIEPVLITQPLLLGAGRDSLTGTDLAKFRVRENENGELYWKRLEAYNDVTRAVAAKQNVHLIDLAHLLPKDSRFFYDEMHFTEAGAARVADVVATDLRLYLPTRYALQTVGRR